MEPDADKLVNREAVGQSVDGFHINLCLSSVPSGSNTALYIIHMLALLHYIYIKPNSKWWWSWVSKLHNMSFKRIIKNCADRFFNCLPICLIMAKPLSSVWLILLILFHTSGVNPKKVEKNSFIQCVYNISNISCVQQRIILCMYLLKFYPK